MKKENLNSQLKTPSKASGLISRATKKIVTIKKNAFDRFKNFQPSSKVLSGIKNSKKTYSQTGEDIIIRTALNELGIAKPTYLDIGAHHPYYLNNTALFYRQGSRGVNIEPDPSLFENFKKFRKKDINLNIGIADKSGSLILYIISSPTLNTFSEKEAKYYEKLGYPIVDSKKIKVMDINSVFKMYFKKSSPDLLSVDVEGLDYQIVKAIDFKKYSPKIICAETIEFSKDGSGKKDLRISNLLTKKGYKVYADTKINTIYIKTTASE